MAELHFRLLKYYAKVYYWANRRLDANTRFMINKF